MDFLLDANAFGDAMRAHPVLAARLESIAEGDRMIICPIVRGEVLYGIGRLPEGKRKKSYEEKAQALFNAISCVATPESAADFYAQVKLGRERQGRSMAENDLWIAATALALDAVLVSRDAGMQRIDGLTVEDWTQADPGNAAIEVA